MPFQISADHSRVTIKSRRSFIQKESDTKDSISGIGLYISGSKTGIDVIHRFNYKMCVPERNFKHYFRKVPSKRENLPTRNTTKAYT